MVFYFRGAFEDQVRLQFGKREAKKKEDEQKRVAML
jgi:hypothetical protein